MLTCFFIGHREASEELFPALQAAVARHVAAGVHDFVVGHYGRFDALVARAVCSEKKRHPQVSLTLLLPYHPAVRPLPLPDGFDGMFYPPGLETVPASLAIVRANRYMADHSSHRIAYACHPGSNAKSLAEYAQRRGVKVTWLTEARPLTEGKTISLRQK